MAKVINKEQLNSWLDSLAKTKEVIVPQKKSGKIVFEKLEKDSQVVLGYKTTFLSIKDFFLPAKEDLFSQNKKGKITVSQFDQQKQIIFGLSSNDLEAMTQLDELMAKPIKDSFYFRRRDNVILIGLSNKSIAGPTGGDLFLEKINKKQYKAYALTKAGHLLIKSDYFKNIKNPQTQYYRPVKSKLKEMLLDAELLAEAVKWSWSKSKIWDELAQQCLGCGICTYVCPLCFCFSQEDRVSLDDQTCSRCRQWDACTLPEFAQVAGNHNFHKSIKERYYNWYYHKFVRAYHDKGKSLCVACGRCQKYCPAGINIETVLERILKEYLKTKNK